MKITTSLELGKTNYKFEIEDADDMLALHKASVLGNPPRECGRCGGDDIRLYSNRDTEGNIYLYVQCLKCKSQANIGLYKSGGFFWKSWKEGWKPEAPSKPHKPHYKREPEEIEGLDGPNPNGPLPWEVEK